MAKSSYNTKQKQIIYDFLNENSDEMLTCDEIFDGLKNRSTPVGKATLYRFLDNLVNDGSARKVIDNSNKSAAYQLLDKNMNCSAHMHLKCICCGKITHLGCDFMHSVGEHILKHHQFSVDNSKTLIYGICGKCSGKGE